MRQPASLRDRLALGAVVVTALCLGVLTVGFNALLSHQLRGDADELLRTRALAAAATLDVAPGGTLSERGAPQDRALDARTWLYEGRRALERASGDDEVQRRADALAGTGERLVQTGEPDAVRFYALPVRSGTRQVGTVVSSVVLDPYERVADVALLASGAFAVLVLGGTFLLSRALIDRALSPVREMTEQAGRWSSTDVDRRFGPGPRPAELAALAATLDGVLDRLSAVLRHERQLSGELSHELRTPLAAVVAEVELLDSRPRRPEELAAGHAAVLAAAERMSRVLESLLTAARATADGPPGRCDVLAAVRAAVDLAAPPEGVLHVEAPVPVPAAGVDAALLERALGPVLDNAVRHCRSSVVVQVCAGAAGPEVAVQDDGPGVEPGLAQTMFEPGVRGEDGHGGAGLGLALARRLARAGGGDLVLAPSCPGAGARLVLSLPPG